MQVKIVFGWIFSPGGTCHFPGIISSFRAVCVCVCVCVVGGGVGRGQGLWAVSKVESSASARPLSSEVYPDGRLQ